MKNRLTKYLPTIYLAAAATLGACGGKDETPAPQQPVQIFTNNKTDCQEKNDACKELALRGVDNCKQSASVQAISQCVGETLNCINGAISKESNCRDTEQACIEMGSDEIRACVRECRDEALTIQSTCTSSQSRGLEDCNQLQNTANNNCLDIGQSVYEACINPVESSLTRCQGDVRIAYNACIRSLSQMRTNCLNECQTGDCETICRDATESARIRCDTTQRLGSEACQDDYSTADRNCRIVQRNAENMCRSNIPLDIRNCSDNVFLSAQRCLQNSYNQLEDCQRGCDPQGSARCDMNCSDLFYNEYLPCISDDWSCYNEKSQEAGAVCDTSAQNTIDGCFDKKQMCEEAEMQK